jgi:hypothetical protein
LLAEGEPMIVALFIIFALLVILAIAANLGFLPMV